MRLIISHLLKTISLITTIGLFSCEKVPQKTSVIDPAEPFTFDLKDIKKRDTLRVITTYSSHSYFLYRGETMSYDNEMARRLANVREIFERYNYYKEFVPDQNSELIEN